MRRREVIAGLAAGWPVATGAQPGGERFRVAYIALLPGLDLEVVKGRLEELGYAQGKNLIFDFRSAERSERLPGLAAEIVGSNPDVIVAGFGTLTAKAAQAASTSIPIVFVSVGDPIGAGVVKSLGRPGGKRDRGYSAVERDPRQAVANPGGTHSRRSDYCRDHEPGDAFYGSGTARAEDRRRRARSTRQCFRNANGR